MAVKVLYTIHKALQLRQGCMPGAWAHTSMSEANTGGWTAGQLLHWASSATVLGAVLGVT